MRAWGRSKTRAGSRLRALLGPLAGRFLAPTDFKRWSRLSSEPLVWDSRTIQMAAMIPAGSRVLDVGAGWMRLRDHLPEGSTYIPLDVVARCPETIVCDLNAADLPVFPQTDVAVLSGVLEYLENIDVLLSRLYDSTTLIIASYAVARNNSLSSRLPRRSQGWVNDFSMDQLLSAFLHRGFHCLETTSWYDQTLFRFRRMAIQPAFVGD